MWKNIDGTDNTHYSIMNLQTPSEGMNALKTMFPDGKANELNFVLFSTSRVHGTYNAIEEAEKSLGDERDEDGNEFCGSVTFLVVHLGLVSLRYGVCNPKNEVDIEFLKKLRSNSLDVVSKIEAYEG